jgi:hypothetical protein
MSVLIAVRFKLTCPHHPRYNPESGGEGAIRAGCQICTEMFSVWKESIALNDRLVTLGEKTAAARLAAKA